MAKPLQINKLYKMLCIILEIDGEIFNTKVKIGLTIKTKADIVAIDKPRRPRLINTMYVVSIYGVF